MGTTNSANHDGDTPTPVQRRAMRHAIIMQCFATISYLSVFNGLLMLYLTVLNVSPNRIIFYISIPLLVEAVLKIPFAYLADRFGKKLVGGVGCVIETIGFGIMALGGFLAEPYGEMCIVVGIVVYSLAITMFAAMWYALLSPIVPESIRGRFFGRLRFAWQAASIVFFTICAVQLNKQAPVGVFQIIMGLGTLGLVIRIVYFFRLPEMERMSARGGGSFRRAVATTLRADGFVSFCCYVFILSLFTVGAPVLFSLVEKKVLDFGDDLVLWLGVIFMLGSLIGFFVGGKAVGRWGTKPVFMICHFGYGLVMLLFLLRATNPGSLAIALLAVVHFAYGSVWAASSIAISTEMLALIPPDNKSISTSICTVLMRLGGALSGALSAWAIHAGFLSEQWTLLGRVLSQYDTVLLGFAMMVIMLVVTLGLVPSVMRKAEWVPRLRQL